MDLRFIAMASLLMAGMILGISFLESWVKFRTPSLTKPVGLEVGKTVFSLFHKVQNIFLIIIICISLTAQISMLHWLLLIGIAIILSLQSFWLLPLLNAQVDLIVAGRQPAPSSIHKIYGIMEVIKLALLMLFSAMLLF